MNKKIRVCVVGAGTAGLAAVKNSLEHQLEVVCYERDDQVGGTWVYKDIDATTVQCDEDVHSSMYQGLRTNLPKEVMDFPDFPYPDSLDVSYISSDVVLSYLNLYADHFKLRNYIKFEHEVLRVKPHLNNEWQVHVVNRKTNVLSEEYFDRIFICNGHYTKPQYPIIPGMNVYSGLKMHSHLYRSPLKFKDETVLIIGAGPSGMDLAQQLSKIAKQVFLSHHLADAPSTDFMGNVIQRPDIKYFTKTGAIFMDDTVDDFDSVIYCTGYQYSFPFLSCDCGIYVKNSHVQPIYKQCINIEHPTMAIIGLPVFVLPTQCFDLQIRFALKFFSNELEFPSKQEMLDDLQRDLEERKEQGMKPCDAHKMGPKQFEYYRELSEIAGITNIRPVITNIMKDCSKKYIYELETYRSHVFKIIDDENFIKMRIK